jgi:hypothetical protein
VKSHEGGPGLAIRGRRRRIADFDKSAQATPMQKYEITEAQLIAAFSKAYLCDGTIYVRLPRLDLDHELPPTTFKNGTSLEDAVAVAERIIPFIKAGREKELYLLDPASRTPADTVH